jgi:hypothetical protein
MHGTTDMLILVYSLNFGTLSLSGGEVPRGVPSSNGVPL